MSRAYDKALVALLKQRETQDTYMGAPLIIKRLPDCNEPGAMDPRLYEDMKSQMKLLKFLPSKLMKIDTSEKGIRKLRGMFNRIKSVPICTMDIQKKEYHVKMKDGYEVPLYQYSQAHTTASSPVVFYIHGGGFFAGHHGVVEESLKLMCETYAFNIFSIDYRLAPEYPYPIGHQDCFETLTWVYEHSDELQINKDLIFVGGDSAGGNLTQYCSSKDAEQNTTMVKGQMLLYATLNMAGIEDEYFHWSLDHYQMKISEKKSLTKMLMMFGGMTDGLESILKVTDTKTDELNPYTRDPKKNPPTFITVGEHDYLKVESLAYAAKLHHAGIPVKTIIYNGLGHAYFDNAGVYPQCEDCIDEMAKFILENV